MTDAARNKRNEYHRSWYDDNKDEFDDEDDAADYFEDNEDIWDDY